MSTFSGCHTWAKRPLMPCSTPGSSLTGRTLAYRSRRTRLPITGDQPAMRPPAIVTGPPPPGAPQPTAPSTMASAAAHRSSEPSGQSRLPCSR